MNYLVHYPFTEELKITGKCEIAIFLSDYHVLYVPSNVFPGILSRASSILHPLDLFFSSFRPQRHCS